MASGIDECGDLDLTAESDLEPGFKHHYRLPLSGERSLELRVWAEDEQWWAVFVPSDADAAEEFLAVIQEWLELDEDPGPDWEETVEVVVAGYPRLYVVDARRAYYGEDGDDPWQRWRIRLHDGAHIQFEAQESSNAVRFQEYSSPFGGEILHQALRFALTPVEA
ncbi:MAG: hypothetical protein H6718_36240 [Polyangiaceae bacterium]|nr:hypothetical protein [Myxococcales bacterium]MCB9590912.1 hypothetical protein [Polyangiaceae bacterium]MCB9609620.1 hypothetical protein [Polyangiaceae bacterium]